MHYLKPYGHAALIAEMKQDEERVLVCSVHLERVRYLKKNKDGFQMSWKEALSLLRDEMTGETPRSGAVEELMALGSWTKIIIPNNRSYCHHPGQFCHS